MLLKSKFRYFSFIRFNFCYSIKTLFSLHMNIGLLLHNMDVTLMSKVSLWSHLYEKRNSIHPSTHFFLKKKTKRLMSRDLKNKIAKFFLILFFKGKIGFNF